MGHKFIIADEVGRNRALAVINALKLDNPHEFQVKKYRRNRSIEQHNRYWALLQKWSMKTGEPAEEIHERMKNKFLIPMLHADSNNEDWQIQVQAVKELRRRGQDKMADFWKQRMIKHASTTDLNTKQHSQYSEQVEGEAAMIGVALDPTDR